MFGFLTFGQNFNTTDFDTNSNIDIIQRGLFKDINQKINTTYEVSIISNKTNQDIDLYESDEPEDLELQRTI